MTLAQKISRPLFIFTIFSLSACSSCSTSKTETKTENPPASAPAASVPKFDENYAWSALLQYEKMGPKVPGTPQHVKTGDWIVAELKKTSATVYEQKTTAKTFDGHTIPVRNIIAQFHPEAKERYLLSAHWDTRPFADQDRKNKKGPIPGVNDGGSGVVVLLGVAKAIDQLALTHQHDGSQTNFGIDLAFWDAEDWGNPKEDEDSYCLGTQYWALHPVPENYTAVWGLNFDMVGRIGSQFPAEGFTLRSAPEVYRRIQTAATSLGYGDYFPNYTVGPITDDHMYVIRDRKIPMADIIAMSQDGMFPPEWHTHQDTSSVLSRDVLKAVAQSSLQAIWNP
jgi:glutaminyl-peptide cyclotransferase